MAHAYSYQQSSSKAAEVLGQGSHGGAPDARRINYYHRPLYELPPPPPALLPIKEHEAVAGSKRGSAPSSSTAAVEATDLAHLLRKQDARLLPLWILIYTLYAVDLTNLSSARAAHAADLAADTGTTEYLYKVAATASLAASALFAAPATLLLRPLLPSRWLAVLLFAAGATSMCLAVASSAAAAAGLRFLAGACRAPIAPALVVHLAAWYRPGERAVRLAAALAPAGFLASFAPAVAAALPAWRWLFIAEGAPTCVAALLVLFLLPDFPGRARWLSPGE